MNLDEEREIPLLGNLTANREIEEKEVIMSYNFKKIIVAVATILILNLVISFHSFADLLEKQVAPDFTLKDLNGKIHALDGLKDQSMVILYFFDAESRVSQEGLISLNALSEKYKETNMLIWGITKSPKIEVQDLMVKSQVEFPVLIDTSDVSDIYSARIILPTVCVIGKQRKVIRHFQGGGKSIEVMLIKLAEVELQRKQVAVAKAISEQIITFNPNNVEAHAIKGYAELDEGNLKEAENTFNTLPSDRREFEILKKEGLAEVYEEKGDFEKAWSLAQTLEQDAPERGSGNAIKGQILLHKGQIEEAEKELTKAVQKKPTFSYKKSEPLYRLAQISATRGRNTEAIKLYQQAEEIDPFHIEATSSKGLVYEKEGRLDRALNAYLQVLEVNQDDYYASVFLKRVKEKLSVESDIEKKKRMDMLVKELIERYHKQKQIDKEEDSWTSRPMVLSFVDLQESGGLPDRDGLVLVIADQLSEYLNASGRLKVVERRLIERVVEELNIGTSDLADPQTALKLGRIFAAKIIGTGSAHYLPNGTLISMRLLDTETSMIPKTFTRQIAKGDSIEKELRWLNREILKTIITKYPLRGFVVEAREEKIIINIGSNQGVVLGTRFDVLKEPETIAYKGKELKGSPKKIALLEVIEVEPGFSVMRIISQDGSIRPDAKVIEKITNL